MKQIQFEWHELVDAEKASEVVFETKTIETTIALMANTLVAVVRAAQQAEEALDER